MIDFKISDKPKVVAMTPIFNLVETKKVNPKGDEKYYPSIAAPNWVSAIIKKGEKFILVKQFRHGVNKILTEFPCGQVEPDESSLNAIIRECKEETGIKEDDIIKIIKLFEHNPNPAFMNNKMTGYFIEVKENINFDELNLDDNEFLEKEYATKLEVENIMNLEDTSAMQNLLWKAFKELN